MVERVRILELRMVWSGNRVWDHAHRGIRGIMNLQSMTGFARAAAEHDGTSIAWEVKSVNGKSVEVRLRLPQGFERLEPAVRQTLQKRFLARQFPGDADRRPRRRRAGAAGGQRGLPEGSRRPGQAAAGAVRRGAGDAPTACCRCAACSTFPKPSKPKRRAPRSTPRSCRRWTRRWPGWSRRARARARRCVRCFPAISTRSRR